MSCFSKVLLLSVVTFSCIFLFVAADAKGHGGRFVRPVVKAPEDDPGSGSQQQGTQQKGISFPGGGPQVPFGESQWEFWWDYNADPLIGLKTALFNLTPQAGFIDYPFEKVTREQKQTKLVSFFRDLLYKEKDADILEAAVISMARTRDESILPWLEWTYHNVSHQYVRTIAVIAMGISQNPGAPALLESIFNDDKVSKEIRIFAAVSVGLAGGENATGVFKKWLEPKAFKRMEKAIQQGVAYGVGLTGDATLAPLVRNILIDKLADDRITVSYLLTSLGRMGDRAANAILLQHLTHKNVQVRRSAAIALGAAASPSDKDVVEGLIQLALNDADNMMKNFCYISLGKIGGDKAEEFLIKELDRVRRGNLPFVALAVGLTGRADFGKKLLARYTSTKDISSRSALALSLALLNYREALGELRKVVDSGGDPVYRGYHALALGLMKDGESVERLLRLYAELNDVELHHFTAMALGLIGDLSVTKQLFAHLSPATGDLTRRSTAYNLGLIGDRKAIDPLKKIASSKKENSSIRKLAILGLGLLGDEAPVPVVSKITRDGNYTILETFMYELYNIN